MSYQFVISDISNYKIVYFFDSKEWWVKIHDSSLSSILQVENFKSSSNLLLSGCLQQLDLLANLSHFVRIRKREEIRRGRFKLAYFWVKVFKSGFKYGKYEVQSFKIQNEFSQQKKKQKINLFSPFQCPSLFLIGVFSPNFIILDLKDSFNKFSRYVLWTYFEWFYCFRLVTKRSENYLFC